VPVSRQYVSDPDFQGPVIVPRVIAACLVACLVAMSSAAASSLWIAESDTLTRLDGETSSRFAAPPALRGLAATGDGEAWLFAADRLWHITRDGDVALRARLDALGVGNAVRAAADPYDASAWIATDAPLLVRVSANGAPASAVPLPAGVAALAVGLDRSVWAIAGDALLHFDRDGKPLGTRALELAPEETATAIAVDALRDRIWIATTLGLHRASIDSAGTGPREPVLAGKATAIAVDLRGDDLIAIVDGAPIAWTDGSPPRALDHLLGPDEIALDVFHDAGEQAFAVRTTRGIVRVERDRVLARDAVAGDAIVAVAPTRIEPELELVRPPDGGALAGPGAEIVVRLAARCDGLPCAVPDSYARTATVTAALGGEPLGDSIVDAKSGTVRFVHAAPLRFGVHRLSASATDRFGHRAMLDARLTVLDRTTTIADAVGGDSAVATKPPAADIDAPLAKAANKPPVVSLTAPASGSIFTAGSSVTLTATATDPDGTISKVEFYRGGAALVGVATSAPYRFVWTNVATGNYSLTAKAYDNRNGTAVSAPITITVTANQVPAVALSAPAAGGFFETGSVVSVEATASDPDGSIARVEFFDGATPIGVAVTAPYRVSWTATNAGVHTLGARATDDRGASSALVSAEILVGDRPIVVVTSPQACASVDGPVDVVVAADARSATGEIASVAFFDGGSQVAVSNAPPWRATLQAAAVGAHTITAVATDRHGLTAVSRPAPFTVRGANQPPTVSITSPSDGARFPSGASIALAAVANDVDGTIARVEYRLGSAGGTLIGQATSPPYATTWSNVAAGSYAVVAVARDDRGATTASTALHVTIDPNLPPAIALTAPVAGASFIAPAAIDVSASASDPDGTVAKVDFYAGATLVATATAPPYSGRWNGVAAGTYSLTAKATDNLGAVAVSNAVTVTVASNAAPTVALTAPAPGAQYFAPTALSLAASAADADGSIARVEFRANGVIVGTVTAAPYRFAWDNVPAGAYALTATAVDDRGASTTSAAVSVTVGAPSIGIAASLDGATIADDNVLVRGFASAPANSSVTVNGVVTHIDDYGRFQANDVRLVPGANVVTAVLTSQDGQTTSTSVTIDSSGRGAFTVRASPTEGLGALDVAFTVENTERAPFARVEFDLDGDGFPNLIALPDQFVDETLTVRATYPAGTWIATVKVYDDEDRVIYETSKSIVVLLPAMLDGKLRSIYDGVLSRLRAGNVPAALAAFTGSAYERYDAIFAKLQPALPAIVDQLGEVRDVTFAMDVAEIDVVRNAPGGPQRFLLYLIRAEDGIWRIDGM
jgi:hypothetical protein